MVLLEKETVTADRSSVRRVLLVVRWPVGGIRTFLKYVITFYPVDEYRFSVLGTSTEGMHALRKELCGLVDEWELVPEEGNVIKELQVSLWKLNRKNSYDIVHAHGFTSAVSCLFISYFTRTPVICTSHDVINDRQFKGAKGFAKKLLLGVALLRCRFLHSVSYDAEKNVLRYFNNLRGKSVVVVNGVNATQFLKAKAIDLKRQLSLPSSTILIGFFGRFMSQKGFRYLVKAIEILNNNKDGLNFHVACFGSGAFIREEQADIMEMGLMSFFTFVPFIPDVSGAMKGCDLIAMPSLWEACPLQPMEALCAGVPFVGSDCIGLREVIEGTPSVMVSAGDAESLAEGILKCSKIGRKPFEDYAPIAVERFDVRKTAEGIHTLYEKVLG